MVVSNFLEHPDKMKKKKSSLCWKIIISQNLRGFPKCPISDAKFIFSCTLAGFSVADFAGFTTRLFREAIAYGEQHN